LLSLAIEDPLLLSQHPAALDDQPDLPPGRRLACFAGDSALSPETALTPRGR
jgi:hypothetical protein